MNKLKKIHYIWLGGKPKPRKILDCIDSWHHFMPDWEIIEWNESNLNLNVNKYCREAYNNKMYAFAADVLRFKILYDEGGLYFDTDVMMLKSFETLVENNIAFVGFEDFCVNPGQVLFTNERHNFLFRDMLLIYDELSFFNVDGSYNIVPVGIRFSKLLEKYGFQYINQYQNLGVIIIFPRTYFCPENDIGSINDYSNNTYSRHLFYASWKPFSYRFKIAIKRFFYRTFGTKNINKLKDLLKWHT